MAISPFLSKEERRSQRLVNSRLGKRGAQRLLQACDLPQTHYGDDMTIEQLILLLRRKIYGKV